MNWSKGSLELAQRLLKKHTALHPAIEEISQKLNSKVTYDSISNAFKRNGLKSPKTYLQDKSVQDLDAAKELKKMPEEALAQHIAEQIALCAEEMKVEPCDMVWADFRAYIKHAFGDNSAGILKNSITRIGGFNTIRDAYFPPPATKTLQERSRLREHAKLNRKLADTAVRQKYLLEEVEKFADRVFSGKVAPSPLIVTKKDVTKRIVTLMLSDLHFGADLVAEETGVEDYGPVEEARRIALVTQEMMDYKLQYRKNTELRILLLGDIIQGKIHDERDGAILSEQMARAIHLLVQVVAQAARAYAKVVVLCTTGNHGRNKARHKERATFQKYDSHETVIYYAIKTACKNLSNVTIEIPKTPYFVYEVFGDKILGTHSDTFFTVGNPSKTIKLETIENKINRLNAALSDMDEYSVACIGHIHSSLDITLNNGVTIFANPALIPPDNFAVGGCGITEGFNGQWIFESSLGFPVGDRRLLQVDKKTNENAALDRIVQRWGGF